MNRITLAELEIGCAAFWKNESRDAMYRIAEKLVEEGWGNPAEVADGLGVVLLAWNNTAYRYGRFDFDELERFLKKNKTALNAFRLRNIESLEPSTDAETVKALFDRALDALVYAEDRRKTPVGMAKALHILAPSFFPLWDQNIAKGCGYNWYRPEQAAAKYAAFMEQTKATIARLEARFADGRKPAGLPAANNLAESLSKRAGRTKTMLKFLGEYLYVTHTKPTWLETKIP